MSDLKSPDVTIIGGGIVGLATAFTFQNQYPQHRYLLLEKEADVGMHQTGHNSGVIHSGIYYSPGSLKAKLCVEGMHAMVQFAEENSVPYELCGKLILATNQKEIPWLHELLERGKTNGVPGLRLLSSEQIKELEPNAAGLLGIHSPKTGIINYRKAAQVLKERFEKNGGTVKTYAKVLKIEKRIDQLIIQTTTGNVQSNFLINCSGLYSDHIAQLMGIQPEVIIVPFRGEYYMIKEERKSIVRNLIYPLPQPDLPFLGVHFTRTIDGKMEAGPNAILAFAREGYTRNRINVQESWNMLADHRFWNMIGQYWKTGIFEFYHAISKRSFVKALQTLVPCIQEEDLISGPMGVRAQCVDRTGTLVNDFKIIESERSIHVLNVPSPAATASLTIADYIVRLAANSFSLKKPASAKV